MNTKNPSRFVVKDIAKTSAQASVTLPESLNATLKSLARRITNLEYDSKTNQSALDDMRRQFDNLKNSEVHHRESTVYWLDDQAKLI